MLEEKVAVIYCATGCSCCSNENHYRGPFKSKEDAERRIKRFLSGTEMPPVASQYARRGRYTIEELDFELIARNRAILNGSRVIDLNEHPILTTDSEGKLSNVCEFLGSADFFLD